MALLARVARAGIMGAAIIASGALGAAAHGAEVARAAQTFLKLDAPVGCSSADGVYRRARERVGYELERGRFSHIHGRIVDLGSELELTLELDEQGQPSTRVLRAESCDDLEGAAAVAIALALGDQTRTFQAPTSSSSDPAGTDRATAEEESAPASRSSPGLVPSIGFRGVLDLGSLSRVGAGLALEGRLQYAKWQVGLTGSWVPAIEERVRSDEAVAFGLIAAGPHVCYRPVDGWLNGAACVGVEAGRFSASGLRLADSRRDLSHWWLSPGVALEVGARLTGGARAVLRGEALRPLVRKEYTINGAERVYATPEVALRLGAGLELSLE